MNTCQFCLSNQILKGKILAENELCYGVESIHPILPNAAMIISKRHVTTPFELTIEEWTCIRELLHILKDYLEIAQPGGYSIGWNVGKVGGQEVEHAHLHIIGRFHDEPLSGKGIRYFLKQENNRRPL